MSIKILKLDRRKIQDRRHLKEIVEGHFPGHKFDVMAYDPTWDNKSGAWFYSDKLNVKIIWEVGTSRADHCGIQKTERLKFWANKLSDMIIDGTEYFRVSEFCNSTGIGPDSYYKYMKTNNLPGEQVLDIECKKC